MLPWLSPIGWSRLTRAFAGERWAVFGLAVGAVVVRMFTIFVLLAVAGLAGFRRRDVV
jgi:ABC-2 type transport system permease protein